MGWKVSSQEWWATQAKRHELYFSREVLRELSSPDFPESAAAIDMCRDLQIAELTPEVVDLADLPVREKVMPGPANQGDALHVACATYHQMDYILTWNVRHLANPNKRKHFAIICARLRMRPPELTTPDLLWELDDAS